MFTGLVALAKITTVVQTGKDKRFTIHPDVPCTNLQQGESIAINGVCLTVESFTSTTFSAFASAETLSVTTLGSVTTNQLVNIERALALGSRLGGHLVSGHVDGVATIMQIQDIGHSRVVRISLPPSFAQQVIPKGSITLDGISLTVNNCGADFLEVNIIPETQKQTTVQEWQIGKKINFETDLIGKYVQHTVQNTMQSAPDTGMTIDFLRENGF